MSRVELAKIRSLTFYKDEETTARRTSPVPQLKCVGRPCRLYQPEVVRCVNSGGEGADIDWKCEADLPESLRFGKVEVSCEGYSKPGDPYVLKGSCGLEYRLVQVPDALRNGKTDSPVFGSSWSDTYKSTDTSAIVFWIVWIAILGFIVYGFLTSCFGERDNRRTTYRNPQRPGGGGGGGGWFSGGGGGQDYYGAPPPPYSKNPPPAGPGSAWDWRPGFWSGALLGGVANHLWNRNQQPQPIRRQWGWEQRYSPFATPADQPPAFRRRPSGRMYDDDNRGEGSSNLGAMRSSIGIGGTNVR